MSVTTSKCAICGEPRSDVICEIPTGRIVRCSGCRTIYRGQLITGAAYDELYQNDATMETPFYLSNKLASDPTKEPLLTFGKGLDRLEQLIRPGRLLDIGCSYGAFMQLAEQRGWTATGVELSRKTAEYAKNERGLNVYNGYLEEAGFPDASFDAITLWDVVEHLDDPVRTLREIDRVLAPNGVLFLFTLNQGSLFNVLGNLTYRVTGGRWKRLMTLLYDIHHNFFFTPQTLGALVQRVGPYHVEAIDYGDANVRRWHTVDLSETMILASDVVDLLSNAAGRRYRMFMYARKNAAPGA